MIFLKLHTSNWKLKTQAIEPVTKYEKAIETIMVNRGIDPLSMDDYLNPTSDMLYDPYLMKDMQKTVDRIMQAIEHYDNVWIYGDYDVDGITSVSLLMIYFEAIGFPVSYYIPDRHKEGYGVNKEAIQTIHDNGGNLLITVDCGITAFEEAALAKDLGIDMIITDHHEVHDAVPDAYAILNPKQTDCNYPYDMLAGVGIAFKLVQALLKDDFQKYIQYFIELAAFGTVADIAPLKDENRTIVKLGLKYMESPLNIGLKALIEVAGYTDKEITAGTIGFKLGPRINAAGRIGDPKFGVQLFTTNHDEEAIMIAEQMDQLNMERQTIEQDILKSAIDFLDTQDLSKKRILVVKGYNWETGIIGIVASRIVEKYYKPTIVLNIEEGVAKGSARSIDGFSIFDALNSCKDEIITFGGHEQAAGLKVSEDNLDAFEKALDTYALEKLADDLLTPTIKVDYTLKANEINYKLLDELSLLEPFGAGHPKPKFIYRGLNIDQNDLIGKNKNHLKLALHDESRVFEGLMFNQDKPYEKNQLIDTVVQLERNSFRGVDTIQLMIKDVRTLKVTEYNVHLIHQYLESFFKSPFKFQDFEKTHDFKELTCDKIICYEPLSMLQCANYYKDLGMEIPTNFGSSKADGKELIVLPIEDVSNASNFGFDFFTKDMNYDNQYYKFKNLLKFFSEMLIERSDLMKLYKTIVNKKQVSIMSLEEELNLKIHTILAGLMYLSNMQLINYQLNNTIISVDTLQRPAEKKNMYETVGYKRVNKLTNLLKSKLEEIHKTRRF